VAGLQRMGWGGLSLTRDRSLRRAADEACVFPRHASRIFRLIKGIFLPISRVARN
jgi:hypothetical protein